MQRIAGFGGLFASVLLIVLGVASMVIGITGNNEVKDTIAKEKIVGTPDMTPDTIETNFGQEVPDCSVANEEIDTGDEAKCFAEYMRVHALEITGGKTFAELPRFLDAKGNPTSDEEAAAIDPDSGEPVENLVRDTWISETAFSTALNTSFFAQQVARFGIVVGLAMLLIGIGFLVLIWFSGLRPVRTDTPS